MKNKTYTYETRKHSRAILEMVQDNKSAAYKIHVLVPKESGILPNQKFRNSLLPLRKTPASKRSPSCYSV